MSDVLPPEREESPTIEVRVFRDGQLISRELCESEEQAALVVDVWAELERVECEVDDLSIHHGSEDVLEPEPAEDRTEDYPRSDVREARWRR